MAAARQRIKPSERPEPRSTPIDKRVAIVTGASRGIGRAIACRLASDGHHVVCVARSEGPLKEAVTEIEGAGGSAEFITCDIGDGEALAALVDGIHDAHGRRRTPI